MTLEIVQDLAIRGASDNALENVSIPTDQPIREIRVDYNGTINEIATAGQDIFNHIFQFLELKFDGQSQYKIENVMDLMNVVVAYTGLMPKIAYQMDTVTANVDVVRMKFSLPVLWTSSLGVNDPRLNIKYSASVTADDVDDGTLTIKYVHTQDTRGWVRFKYIKDEKEATTDDTLTFRPDQGATVRGVFIRAIDASVTDLYNGGSKYSLGFLGGSLTLAEITLRHNGVSYWDKSLERDIMHAQERLFPKLDFPMFSDSANVAGNPYGLRQPPFHLTAVEQTTTAQQLIFSSPQGWLYISFEDLVSNANTILRIKTGSSNWASSDQVSVIWVYRQLPASDDKSV